MRYAIDRPRISYPLVFLTGEPSIPMALVALYHGTEVFLGALSGAALHWLTEIGIKVLSRRSIPAVS